MKSLRDALAEYLALRRALGTQLREPGTTLDQFLDFLEREGSEVITIQLALRWATLPVGVQRATWARRLSMVRQFAAWRSAFDPRTEVPPMGILGGHRQRTPPHIYSDYATLRRLVPHSDLDVNNMYEEVVEQNAYFPPSVISETPLLWIPRDEGGISRQEVAHSSKVIPITDEGCTMDEKNKLVWDSEGARPPLWTPKIDY